MTPNNTLPCKQPGPCDSAAALGSKPLLHMELTSNVVEYLCECVIIDVTIAGHQNRTLVDSGANACFVTAAFYFKSGIRYHRSCHWFASLGDGQQSATIFGKTVPLESQSQRCYKISKLKPLETVCTITVVVPCLRNRSHCPPSPSLISSRRSLDLRRILRPLLDGFHVHVA
jgi:hypothetical protein